MKINHRKLLAAVLLIVFALGSRAVAQRGGHRGKGGGSDAAASELEKKVNSVIKPWRKKDQLPGIIVVVRMAGKTHYFPYGFANEAQQTPVTPDSIFELASVTKVFTTTSLAMDVKAKHMTVQDTVALHVPYLNKNGGDIKTVTLQQLATHTSSLPRTPGKDPSDGEWTKRQLMEWFAQWKAPYPPGTKYLYSNIGVGLLGDVIEDYSHKKLIDVWNEQFLGPLGMQSTFFEIPASAQSRVVQGYNPSGNPVPHSPLGGWPAAGRLNSSGKDMGAFLVANMGEQTGQPAITRAMKLAQGPFFIVSPKLTMGLAWQRVTQSGMEIIDKNGGLTGTSTYIGFLPGYKIGVVLMTNKGKAKSTGIGRQLLFELAGKKYEGGDEEDDQED